MKCIQTAHREDSAASGAYALASWTVAIVLGALQISERRVACVGARGHRWGQSAEACGGAADEVAP